MKKDRWRDWEDKYWEGKSSLEEEQSLKKSTEVNPYFNSLESVKKEQMDWDFDDFIHQVGNKEEKTVSRSMIGGLWKYMAFAAVLLLVGFLFLKDRQVNPDTEEVKGHMAEISQKEGPLTPLIEPNDVPTVPIEVEISPVPRRVASRRQQIVEPISVQQDLVSDEEAYVLVNGVPVYDEKEVEQIVMASLQLMANNIQEGREAVEKMKYLKVKLL